MKLQASAEHNHWKWEGNSVKQRKKRQQEGCFQEAWQLDVNTISQDISQDNASIAHETYACAFERVQRISIFSYDLQSIDVTLSTIFLGGWNYYGRNVEKSV